MQQVIKQILIAGLLVCGLPSARAYSLGGPSIGEDTWQVEAIGYNLPTDVAAPKNIGEGYRRNTPTLYWAPDVTFLDYFGSNGVVALSDAFSILNSLQNVSSYSANLSEFPLETRHINFQAQALNLLDLKTYTLGLLVENLGLVDPVRFAWDIRIRDHVAGEPPCPLGMEYLVVQRNFDYVTSPLNQLQYSPYVNDTLYSYEIEEVCAGSPELAVATPFAVDLSADTYSPVASLLNFSLGAYYTGLTRDDVAGLRSLIRAPNLVTESVNAQSTLFTITTNTTEALFPTTSPVAGTGGFYVFDGTFGYGDYGWLVATSLTNSPAALQALYPGLIIASSTNYFVNVTNYTYTQYYANSGIGQPYPPPLVLVTKTNKQVGLQERYFTTFANVFTNHVSPTTTYHFQTTTVSPNFGAPYPAAPVTNNTTQNITRNIPSGDFFLLSPFYTNFCPLDIVRIGLTNVQMVTNFLTGATTNVVTITTTNTTTSTFTSTMVQIGLFTNYTFIVNPVTCTESGPPTGLYEGIERIQFVYAPYDAEFSQVFAPVTNNYSLVAVTGVGGQATVQKFQRIVTAPDFLFRAVDQGDTTSSTRTLAFGEADVPGGQSGPGTIVTPTTITFNKVGPLYYNDTVTGSSLTGTPYFTETPGTDLSGDEYFSEYYVWASFAGGTNVPVIYPNGASIADLQTEALVQITTTPGGPLAGAVGTPINIGFSAAGGALVTPYTWSATGLPPGVSIMSNADNTGALYGTPTQAGAYVFNLTLTDSLSRSVTWRYSLTIQ